MLQNGTCDPLWRVTDLEALQEWDSGEPVWCSAEGVSRLLHKTFLLEFVEPGMRVLEVGAGAGSLTQTLVRAECRVVIAEMSSPQLERHRARSIEMGFDDSLEGRILLNTRDLSPIAEESFDMVVCFGGWHAGDLAGADPTIPDGARVCRPGGFLLLSVLSLSGAVHGYLHGGLRVPSDERAIDTVSGQVCPRSWVEARRRCRMFRAEELRRAAQEAGLEVVAMSASNLLSLGWEPFLPLSGENEEWGRELLCLELAACREEDSLDMGRRILLAGKKG